MSDIVREAAIIAVIGGKNIQEGRALSSADRHRHRSAEAATVAPAAARRRPPVRPTVNRKCKRAVGMYQQPRK